MTFDKDQTVREIAINYPASVRVFENLGIDYCCGGRLPLEEACSKAKVPIAKTMALLGGLDVNSDWPDDQQWANASFLDLAAHIVNRHHRYVRDEAPRVQALLQKVVSRHGEAHSEVGAIQQTFAKLSEELSAHMMKEERVLFPFLEQMEVAASSGGPFPVGCFPSIEFPI